jgi:demethylmenaquinone methyltransferase/2-methoxy-6-polyprenyl-1,4-benzoquinol methylase
MVSNQSKSAHVHDVFSHIAKRYDVMNSVLSFWQHKLWRRFAMKRTNLTLGGSALDVACGTGDWTLSLANVVGKSGKVVGLDFVEEMLQVAKIKMERRGILDNPVSLVAGNAMELPFKENAFDVATIGFALRNVPDVLTVLQEMTRVVKPGGQVVSLELSKPQWKPFRAIYYFYFYKVLPLIGSLVVGKKEPYAWLPESLTDFPDRKALEGIFRTAGLTNVKSYPLTGGVAALHIGTKLED